MSMDALKKDLIETTDRLSRAIVSFKLLYYRLQRPIASFILRRVLSRRGADVSYVDRFLVNDGGMFKSYTYDLCDRLSPIKGSKILVPGVGYGKNILQLASLKPSLIVAFDPYGYTEEWEFLVVEVKGRFGVDLVFVRGDESSVPEEYKGVFDIVISDAVFEHVNNLPKFIGQIKSFLKDGGLMYASFGPVWYGPSGDHIDWGDAKLYDHLLLDDQEYEESLDKMEEGITDSTTPTYIARSKMFSYLKVQEYLDVLDKESFKNELICAKISTRALSLLKSDKVNEILNNANVPSFDRYCGGIYLWTRLKS